MIQITCPQKLTPRENPSAQSGTDQDIYRVLSIAQTDKAQLYTPAEVAKLGWCPEKQNPEYLAQKKLLFSWARSKGINKYSDHRDKNGRRKRPDMWLGQGWQDRVSDYVWNNAVEIMDEVLRIKEHDELNGLKANTYWYDINDGVITVSPENYDSIVEHANNLFLVNNEHQPPKEKQAEVQSKGKGDLSTTEEPKSRLNCRRGWLWLCAAAALISIHWIYRQHPVLTTEEPFQDNQKAVIQSQKQWTTPKLPRSNRWAENTREWKTGHTVFIPKEIRVLDKVELVGPTNIPNEKGLDVLLYAATGSHPFYMVTPYETLISH